LDFKEKEDFMDSARWVTGHGVAQFQLPGGAVPSLAGKTLRAEITNGISGDSFRVVLGEQYGAVQVVYGVAAVELRGVRTSLTFDGKPEVTVAAGKQVISDPVHQSIAAGDSLTLWLYNAGGDSSESGCLVFASHSAPGNFCGKDFNPEPLKPAPGGQDMPEMFSGYCRLEVETGDAEIPRVIAAFGDSITAMGLWTRPLAEKLAAASPRGLLLNYGISGNRLLRDTSFPVMGTTQFFGRAGLTRFLWDIDTAPGLHTVLAALGVNDISQPGGDPGMSPDISELCSAGELINGFRRLIALCHDRDLPIAGSTISPFGGYKTYNEKTAAIWREVNLWIREGGEFDLVIDFAGALTDPGNPDYMLAQYDSGDHLHPSEAGGVAMAAAVPLADLLD
jgi:lysophospholipase L1-like esterase